MAQAAELRQRDPETYRKRSLESMAKHVEGMLALQNLGAVTFDYGNNIRTFAYQQGVKNAYDFPGFVPAYIRPLFCEGRGPFRWAALSGEPSDIHRTDQLVLDMSRTMKSSALDQAGAEAGEISRASGANLLVGIRRARQVWAGAE